MAPNVPSGVIFEIRSSMSRSSSPVLTAQPESQPLTPVILTTVLPKTAGSPDFRSATPMKKPSPSPSPSGIHRMGTENAAAAEGAGEGAGEGEGEKKRETEGETGCERYVKCERLVGGAQFLSDGEGDRGGPVLRLTKSEASEATEATESEPEIRKQLLEYLIQNDGSVVCKWCGEVLPSRTRWYRHKYKLHVTHQQLAQPAPLFKCHSCNAFFKSRKGYIGHLSSRHSDNEQNENDENKEVSAPTANKKPKRTSSEPMSKGPDWEQQREKEEKLVADIIDRVKRECEAQGETVTRRGYSRRSTVMNS